MKMGFRLAPLLMPLLMNLLLGACTQLAKPPETPEAGNRQPVAEHISNWLPGAYSNFAQTHEDDTAKPVTDVKIRKLKTAGEPVFLLESQQRDSSASVYDIYWLKLNQGTQEIELHFAHLRADELTLAIPDVLAAAWQRVVPGCVIVMSQSGELLEGRSNPQTCFFEHLLQGETRLERFLSLGAETLNIENTLTVPAGQVPVQSVLLKLQKHHTFEGWASTRTPAGPDQDRPGEWQLSNVFNIRDDGRINRLYDTEMNAMQYGLQLAKLPWREGEPPYMLLSIINMEHQAIQGYSWFEPESESINLNLDWFQTNLEAVKQAGPEP